MKTAPSIEIQGRRIGPGEPTYVIAELSGNHHADYAEAVALVKAAKEAGVDAVKLQTFTPDSLTLDCSRPEFIVSKGSLWQGEKLYDLYRKVVTPWEWQPKLKKLAESLGLQCFSSPFSPKAADFLEKMGMPAYKIASFELVDLPLITYVAKKRKPLLMSTGLANFSEIGEAVGAARAAGCKELLLLKCNSAYPAAPEEMNLRTIPDMAKSFGVPVGLSDHTLGSTSALGAVALGACLVEKHFTLSRKIKGPDSAFSMEPREFKDMMKDIRRLEKSLGSVSYGPTASEMPNLPFRRSLFVVKDMRKGERFTAKNVRSIRPGQGLAPKYYDEILALKSKSAIERGTPLRRELVAGRLRS
jgi:N-acetylneuraminate synthase